MKLIRILLSASLVLTACGPGYAFVDTGAGVIYTPGSNNVGIGKLSPSSKLEVNGSTAVTKLLSSGPVNGATANFATGNFTNIVVSGVVNGVTTSFDGDYANGSVLFANAGGVISQANSQLYWDRNNNRLSIGRTLPAATLDINGTLMVRGGSPGAGKFLKSDANGLTSWTAIPSVDNASTLDGLDSTQFLRSDASTTYSSGTIAFNSGTTVDINSTSVSIADTDITLDGASTTLTQTGGAITLAPAAGSNVNLTLSGAGDFAVATDKLYVDTSASKVGINDSTPSTALDVTGTINATGQVNGATANFTTANFTTGNITTVNSTTVANSGTISTAKLLASGTVNGVNANFTNLVASGIFNGTTSSFDGDFTNGSILFSNEDGVISQANSQLYWDKNNNRLAIGKLSPATALDVNGQIMLRGGSPGAGKFLTSDANGKASWSSVSSVSNASTLDGLDSTQFLRADTSTTFSSGTLTVAGGTTLDINSTAVSIADTDITLDGASTTFTQTTGAMTLYPANGSNMNITLDGVSDFKVDSTKLVVDNNGNVGIGTAAPTANLHVTGGTYLTAASSATPLIINSGAKTVTGEILTIKQDGSAAVGVSPNGALYVRDHTGNSGAAGGSLQFQNSGGTAVLALGFNGGSDFQFYNYTNLGYQFLAGASSPWTGLYVSSGGKVGIQSTSPAAMLHINTYATSNIGQIIRALASQTANLTEWQDGSSVAKTIIDNGGRMAIGKSSVASGVKLDVNGQIMLRGGSPGAGKFLTSDANGKASWSSVSSVSNASTLDGLDSTQFLRADTSTTYTSGTLTTNNGTTLSVKGGFNINGTALNIGALSQGSILFSNTASNLKELSKGTNHYVLKVNGNALAWEAGNAYWSLSSSNLSPVSTGYNVSVGHSSPDTILDLNGALTFRKMHSAGGASNPTYASYATNSGWNTTSPTVNKPTGVTSGDLIILVLACNTVSPSSPPSGFTLIESYTGSAPYTFAYYKIADGGEGSSFTFTMPSNVYYALAALRYTDVNTSSPIGTHGASGAESLVSPSITTSAANSMVIRVAGAWDGGSGSMTGVPASHTERANVNYTVDLSVAEKLYASAGATGTGTFTDPDYTHSGALTFEILAASSSSDPSSPDLGSSVLWMADANTSAGSNGDIMLMVNGGSLKTVTLFDYSTGLIGSTSNASTLSGVSSTSFLRSDASDSFTSGTMTFDAGTTLDLNTTTLQIADTDITLDGASTTFTQSTGAITLAPAAGSKVNVSGTLSASGQVNGTTANFTTGNFTTGNITNIAATKMIASGSVNGANATFSNIYSNGTINGSKLVMAEGNAILSSSGYGTLYVKSADSELYFDADDQTAIRLTNNGSLSGVDTIDDLTDALTDTYSMYLGSGGGTMHTGNLYATGLGIGALQNNNNGSLNNTAIGYQTMYTNNGGDYNTALGFKSLYTNTKGSSNTAIGNLAMYNNVTGTNGTALGFKALYNGTGLGNIAIGYNAGNNITTGTKNIIIGHDVQSSSATASNRLNIGNIFYGDLNNGNVGIGINNISNKLTLNGNLAMREASASTAASGYGNLYVNSTDSELYFDADDQTAFKLTNNGALAALAAGSNTQFQFNDSGSFGANGALTFTKASKTLAIAADAPLDINSTTVSIADTDITLDGASTTFTQSTGAITLTPAAGSRVNVSGTLSASGQVNGATANFTTGNITNIAATKMIASGSVNGATANFTTGNFTTGNITNIAATKVIASGSVNGANATFSNIYSNGTINGSKLVMAEGNAILSSSGYGTLYVKSADSELYFDSDDQTAIRLTNNGSLSGVDTIDDLTDALTDTYSMYLGSGGGTMHTGNLYATGVGIGALQNNNNGSLNNTAMGYQTMYTNNGGDYNTALGFKSLYTNTKGSSNTAIGNQAMYSNVTGANGTALGFKALYNGTGLGNIAIGYNAGNNITSGTKNIIIGHGAQSTSATASNRLNIGNTIYGDTNNGNIGIGTTTPSEKLQVAGTTSATRISVKTTTGNAVYDMDTDLSHYQFLGYGSANKWGIYDANAVATRFTLDGNGNVGIGTSTPSYKLAVSGNMNATGSIIGSTNVNGATANFTTANVSGTTSTGKLLSSGTVNGTMGVFSGNVGIGGVYPSTYSLHVYKAAGSSTGIIETGLSTGVASFYVKNPGRTWSFGVRGDINGNPFAIADNSVGATRMLVNKNGDVGIAAVPEAQLHVGELVGANSRGIISQQTSGGTYGGKMTLRKSRGTAMATPLTVNNGDILGELLFQGHEGTHWINGGMMYVKATGAITTNGVPGSIYFQTSTNASPSVMRERMVIRDSGNVGIGYLSPTSLLAVNGTAFSKGLNINGSALSLTQGALLYSKIAGSASTLAKGTNHYALKVNGNALAWEAVGGSSGSTNIDGLSDAKANATDYFIGNGSGSSWTPGATSNTALGVQSLYSVTTGTYNNAHGYWALRGNKRGTGNNAFGYLALQSTNGDYNTAMGHQALYQNTQGSHNIGIGFSALNTMNTGTKNSTLGNYALNSMTTGSNNVSVGYTSGYYNVTGSDNVLLGYQAGYGSTSNSYSNSTFVGDSSGYSNTTGANGTALGYRSMYSNTSGQYNTGVGHSSLYYNATGIRNTALGYLAGEGTSGQSFSNGLFLGYGTGLALTTGRNNTMVGYSAGAAVTTGNGNILLGHQAGDAITTGGKNIVIGYDIDAPSNTTSNQLTIGNLIFGTGLDGTGTSTSSGNIGIATSSPSYKLDVTGTIRSTTGANFATSSGNLGVGNTSTSYKLDVTGDMRSTTGAYFATSSGNVGVGTTSPGAILEVSKNSAYNNESATGISILSGASDSKLTLGADASNDITYIQSMQQATSYSTRPLSINPNGGNVGIGTIAVGAALEVNGTIMNSTEYNIGNSGTSKTINWVNGNKQYITLTGNCTFTFSAPSGGVGNFLLRLVQDGTGGRTVTWPASVKWPSATAPTLTTTASREDIVSCYYNGTNYYCAAGLDFR